MASYLTGIPEYIPQIQPFVPDFNFLGNVLQTKQSRYDAGHKQMSQLYGTLLNSPMSRDENISKRNEFFKQIDGQMKQITGLDLSLQQNQDYAKQIFDPLIEDKSIVKDMTWTKQWQNELTRADSLRNCVDPDKCGGQYWEGGVQALNYRRQNFMKASTEEALGFSSPKFVAAQNLTAKVSKLLSDSKFKIVKDEIKGGYKVTTINGGDMVASLQSYLTSTFATDPSIQAYFKEQAFVMRENFIANNSSKYGGDEQAELTYINDMYKTAAEGAKNNLLNANKDHDNVKNIKESYTNQIKKDKILPSETNVISDWDMLSQAYDATGTTVKHYEDNYKYAENMGFNMNNVKVMGDRIDSLIGGEMLKNQLFVDATNYANLTSEYKKEPDAYGLAKFNSELSYTNAAKLKGIDLEIWKQKELFKNTQEQKRDNEINGLFDESDPSNKPTGRLVIAAKGATTDEIKGLALKENTIKTQSLQEASKGNMQDFINQLATTMMDTQDADPNNTYLTPTANRLFSYYGIDAKKLLGSPQDRQEAIEQLNKLSYDNAKSLYNEAINILDPNTPSKTNKYSHVWSTMNRDWTKSLWGQTADLRDKTDENLKGFKVFSDRLRKESLKSSNDIGSKYLSKNTELKKEYPGQYKDEIKVNDLKKDLIDYVVNNSLSGIFPMGDDRIRLAAQWARDKKTIDKFGNNSTKVDGIFSDTYYKNNTEFALDNINDLAAEWSASYSGNTVGGKSWTHLEDMGMGNKSNAKMGTAMSFDFNTSYGAANANNRQYANILNNWSKTTNPVARFGDGSELGNDPEAIDITNRVMGDLKNKWTWDTKNKKNINMEYMVQSVSAYNPDFMSMTFKLDKDYLENEVLKTVPIKNKAAEIEKYNRPITVYIPIAEANNIYYNNTQLSNREWAFKEHEPIVIKNSGAGEIEIRNSGKSILITANLITINPKGEKINKNFTISKSYTGLSPDMIHSDWTEKLKKLEQLNNDALIGARNKYGITLEKALSEMTK